jgi:hypothetical protein
MDVSNIVKLSTEGTRLQQSPGARNKEVLENLQQLPKELDGKSTQTDPVTPEERQFFAKLFPGSPMDAPALVTYSPAGLRSAGVHGTVIDRKG